MTANVKLPDVSGYVWDGKEEPILPPAIFFLDALEVTLQSIKRCEELSKGYTVTDAFEEAKLNIMRYINYMKAIAAKERKAVYLETARNRRKEEAKNRVRARVAFQNEDTSPAPKPNKKAITYQLKSEVGSRIRTPSMRDICRAKVGGRYAV